MTEDSKLEMSRLIRADRAFVFEAWTEPRLLENWFAPGPMTVVSAEADVRVGGSFRIAMTGDNGSGKCVHAAVQGIYQEINPPEYLRFTWFWPDSPTCEMTVAVELSEVPGGTEVKFTHCNFSSSDDRERHVHGWNGCLDKLERFCLLPVTQERMEPSDGSYGKHMTINACRERVFAALTTPDEIQRWWATSVAGSGKTGGTLRLEFEGLDEHILMRVDDAKEPEHVRWTCLVHTDLPEWSGTRPVFELQSTLTGGCELFFHHEGLRQNLQCYGHCKVGWDRFLSSLASYVESGQGSPYRSMDSTASAV